MKRIALLLLLLAASAAGVAADAPDRLAQLKENLDSVRAEQQSVYQNYQMLKELRLHEVQEGAPPMQQHPYGLDLYTPPPGYEDVLHEQQAREVRIQQYTAELGRLTVRFLELENAKKALQQKISELQQQGN